MLPIGSVTMRDSLPHRVAKRTQFVGDATHAVGKPLDVMEQQYFSHNSSNDRDSGSVSLPPSVRIANEYSAAVECSAPMDS